MKIAVVTEEDVKAKKYSIDQVYLFMFLRLYLLLIV